MCTRRALLSLSLVLAMAAPPRAIADDRNDADALNSEARDAYDAGHFAQALELFKKAYEKVPLPKYLFNAAKACLHLDDPESASHYDLRYLAAAPTAADRAEVEEEIAALRTALNARGLVRLVLSSDPPGAALTIDGATHPEITTTPAERWLPPGDVVVAATLPARSGAAQIVTLAPGRAAKLRLDLLLLPTTGRLVVDAPPGAEITVGDLPASPGVVLDLSPGDYVVRVELTGHQPFVESVTLAAGDDRNLTARPVPLPPPPVGGGLRVAGWVTLAAGGAALVTGAVLTGLGAQRMKDANASHDTADSAYVSDFGKARDLYHGGLGTLGGGAGAALTGGLLLLLAPKEARPE